MAYERGDLPMAEVQDNMTALLLAGHDTSAVTLSYVWYELSHHAAIQESLVEECRNAIGSRLPRK